MTDALSRASFLRTPLQRERFLVYAALITLVVFRSALFFRLPLDFDSDEAVFGLMAKHLAEGRAFPLFMYGQNYILAVEAWLAAPLFLLFGPSVAALKAPLFAINIAVGVLLVWLLERECGLRPLHGLVSSLFFVLAPPGTVATLMAASGGNVEPFLYILLLWMVRRRPVWFGLISGLGFLHREFTIYGVLGVILVSTIAGTREGRDSWRVLGRGLGFAVGAWLVVQFLHPFASAAGPGTTMASLARVPTNNLVEVFKRSCFEPDTLLHGLTNLVTVHWVRLFGTQVAHIRRFNLESDVVQGQDWLGPALAAVVLLMVVRISLNGEWSRTWWQRSAFCAYLLIVGGLSAALWVLARCGTVSPLRYGLLAILGAVGLTAWFLSVERRRAVRGLAIAVVLGWAGISALAHGHLWDEYFPHPRVSPKLRILAGLDAAGVRYAKADYWNAYYLTFLSGERVIVASDALVRISEYNHQVDAHRAEAVHISNLPCGARPPVEPGVYFCPY